MRYSQEELNNAALRDLESDARTSREQAEKGPFWPDRGITRESLLAYADKCESDIARLKNGGAHAFVIKGA